MRQIFGNTKSPATIFVAGLVFIASVFAGKRPRYLPITLVIMISTAAMLRIRRPPLGL
ncbi:hypothetical protein CHK_1822 [Christensenella hongkongensis]|uniref:Uncharacterized protein n=1 Tax=Christensenella hongkongensis TaxID=270498 RepID=A0A0M2NJT9_9FIRM|nr:hypothetical protein CHK_1822 [Christensenella hongkongensis]